MIRRPPRSTLFPTRRSSDLPPRELFGHRRRPRIEERQHQRISRAHSFGVLVSRSEEHTSELQSHHDLVCRLLLEKKNLQNESLPSLYIHWRILIVLDFPSGQ